MATTSPPPTSNTTAVSPASLPSPPPPPPPPPLSSSFPPETSINSSTSRINATAPSTSSPPPQLAPSPAVSSTPLPSTPSTPPPQTPVTTAPPETSPPPPPPTSSAADPPSASSSPPPPPPPPSQSPLPPVISPLPSTSLPPPSPPPPSSTPPTNSPPLSSTPPPLSPPSSTPPPLSPPPPPSSTPPPLSPPPPPSSTPPPLSPPPPPPPSTPPDQSPTPPSSSTPPQIPPTPPTSAPPPQSSTPPTQSTPSPQNSPPPLANNPPTSSPPPPASAHPPKSSPPQPPATPPETSPPPPSSTVSPPSNAPPPPKLTPTSQPTSPSSNHTPIISPPPPTVIRLSPPPPSPISPATSPPSSVNNTTPVSSGSTGSGGIGTGGLVAIGVGVGIVVLSLIGLISCCLRKQRKDASGLDEGYVLPSPAGCPPSSDSIFSKMQSTALLIESGSSSSMVYSSSEPSGLGNSRSWLTYQELVEATNGFSSKNLLGEGGFGSVYKGCLPDGRVVAVKQLKTGGGQGEREFKAEVEIITRIHHRHLVSLVGYCIAENQRLLVYEYVPNNTLYFHLHGEGRPVLDWATRVKIAAGAARGIAYLHEDCHPRIIHRDIKSSNILLDNNYEAKVSDFGLAKLALDANTHVTTRVIGTFGYMAPEYASSGKLTEKSDVFSYGVVLLELITGRKPVDPSQPLGDESLVEWARPLLSYVLDNEEFGSLVDPRLKKNYVESEMFRMIEAAAACVRHLAVKRPRMGQVVRAFDSLATADLTNGMRVGESEVFNSAEQSAQIRLFRRMAFGSQNYSTDFFSHASLDSGEYIRNTSREQYRSSIDSGVSQIELEP